MQRRSPREDVTAGIALLAGAMALETQLVWVVEDLHFAPPGEVATLAAIAAAALRWQPGRQALRERPASRKEEKLSWRADAIPAFSLCQGGSAFPTFTLTPQQSPTIVCG